MPSSLSPQKQFTERVQEIVRQSAPLLLPPIGSPASVMLGVNVPPDSPQSQPTEGVQVYGVSIWGVEPFGMNYDGTTSFAEDDGYDGPV